MCTYILYSPYVPSVHTNKSCPLLFLLRFICYYLSFNFYFFKMDDFCFFHVRFIFAFYDTNTAHVKMLITEFMFRPPWVPLHFDFFLPLFIFKSSNTITYYQFSFNAIYYCLLSYFITIHIISGGRPELDHCPTTPLCPWCSPYRTWQFVLPKRWHARTLYNYSRVKIGCEGILI